MGKHPRLLIATWLRWSTSARIAGALIKAGARVDVVCPLFHPILSITGLHLKHPYRIVGAARSLVRAIEQSEPDLIIACDDHVVGQLQRLRETGRPEIAALIERSLGPSSAYEVASSRSALVGAAREAGVIAPETTSVGGARELDRWLEEHGAPAFLKLDGTCGGVGVRLIETAEDAAAAFASLARPPRAVSALKQALRYQLFTQAGAFLSRRRASISVQKAAPGRAANCSAFAWRGTVLAVTGVEVLETTREFGVATVVRVVSGEAMREAAVRIARDLRLTGFFGLDFMLDRDGRAQLIELNLRPTPISHFATGERGDLISALLTAVTGSPVQPRPSALANGTVVALFPHQLSASRVDGAVCDLPFDQPGLIRAFTPIGRRLRARRHEAIFARRRICS
jgi:predicted ATP-grasp superfamily ATP-dependent carboligase